MLSTAATTHTPKALPQGRTRTLPPGAGTTCYAEPPRPQNPVQSTLGENELGPDFSKLWLAHSLSVIGIAASNGVFTLIGIQHLSMTPREVTWMIAISGLCAGLFSLPLGPIIERSKKRPILVWSDVGRSVLLGICILLMGTSMLASASLMLVFVLLSILNILFGSSSGAHLRDLLDKSHWPAANSRMESSGWIATAMVTPISGIMITYLGPEIALALNCATYLLSAALIRSLTTPEPPQSDQVDRGGLSSLPKLSELYSGWVYLFQKNGLRVLFVNAMLFGGVYSTSVPLIAFFILDDLELSPWAYGLVIGLPAAAGFLGSWSAQYFMKREQTFPFLKLFGFLRGVWLILIPFAPDSSLTIPYIVIVQFLAMLCCGFFNPLFATHRMHLIDRSYMARVSAAWPISATMVTPFFIVLGGLLATETSTRIGLLTCGFLLLVSGVPLLGMSTSKESLVAAEKNS